MTLPSADGWQSGSTAPHVRNSFQEPSSDSPGVSRRKAPSGSLTKHDLGSQPPLFTKATQTLQISKSNFSSLSQHGSLRNLDRIVSLRAERRRVSAKLTGLLQVSDIAGIGPTRDVGTLFKQPSPLPAQVPGQVQTPQTSQTAQRNCLASASTLASACTRARASSSVRRASPLARRAPGSPLTERGRAFTPPRRRSRPHRGFVDVGRVEAGKRVAMMTE